MNRRAFLSGSLVALATPLAGEAQQAEKVVRVGWLWLVAPTSPEVQTQYGLFLRGMRDLGWVEGRNMVIEARHVAGRCGVGLLGVPEAVASECGSLCHGDGAQGRAPAPPRQVMLAIPRSTCATSWSRGSISSRSSMTSLISRRTRPGGWS